ncbi:DUF5808 domain-containing protein [Brachybacterium sp. JHP9]|uniref:DUF5808 domain-containing protein n=1 Tax=Brachybacterium equifaecis TaxID=2910770 RepID=A0ABT0QWH0_9MICO|nr:DUF5808 domain-containing protein [Brachybacterium equifaecis]MCL6422007.1 DUF5808 domain-containing protein [Brachybacterium equifaecis]
MGTSAALALMIAVPAALVGAAMIALPALSRSTVPLGVDVPSDRAGDPRVRSAVRAYRWRCAAVTVLFTASAAAIPFLVDESRPALLMGLLIALPLLETAALTAVFVRSRRPILAAKRAERWFDGARTARSAVAGPLPHRVPGWTWAAHLVAVLLVLLPLPVAVARCEHLPDPYPTHWDASGAPDAFAPLSAGTVLSPVWIGLGCVLLVAGIGALLPRLPMRTFPDGDADGAPQRARRELRGTAGLLAAVNAGVGLLMCAVTLPTLLGLSRAQGAALMWGGFVALNVMVIGGIIAVAVRRRREPWDPAKGEMESADEDSRWIGGLLYADRSDPSVLVPKRNGIGYTLNLASTGGMIATALLVLLVAGSLALPFLVA